MSLSLFRPRLGPEALAASAEVLESGWIQQGPQVTAFESAFADYLGVEHCVAVSSGTAALHLALHVLDLPPGSEVITTPLTFMATHHAIAYVGCEPVLADIEPGTGNLDVADVERKITERTRALLPVHYAGYPCDLDAIRELAAVHSLAIVEDCAHATGASYHGVKVGAFDSLQCFSFAPTKNVTTVFGGAITASHSRLVERMRRLRSWGREMDAFEVLQTEDETRPPKASEAMEVGFRYELSDMNAAIGIAQLRELDGANERRAEVAGAYRAGLEGLPGVQLLRYERDRESSCWIHPILVEDRDELARALMERGIEVGVHYRPNRLLADQHRGLGAMDSFWRRTLSLPLHPGLRDDEVDTVIAAVRTELT